MPFPLDGPVSDFTEEDKQALEAKARYQRREEASELIQRNRKVEAEKADTAEKEYRVGTTGTRGGKTVDIEGERGRQNRPTDRQGTSQRRRDACIDSGQSSSPAIGGQPSCPGDGRQPSTPIIIRKAVSSSRTSAPLLLSKQRLEESSSLTSLTSSSPPSSRRLTKKAKSCVDDAIVCARVTASPVPLEVDGSAVSLGKGRSSLRLDNGSMPEILKRRNVKNPRRLPDSPSPAYEPMQPEPHRLSPHKNPPIIPGTDSEMIRSAGERYPSSAGHAFFGFLGAIDVDARERTKLADHRLSNMLRAAQAHVEEIEQCSEPVTAEEKQYQEWLGEFVDRGDLCDYCCEPMPSEYSEELRTLLAQTRRKTIEGTASFRHTMEFCSLHQAETTIIPLGWRAGFPKNIDFLSLPARVECDFLRIKLESILYRPNESHFFRVAAEEIEMHGKRRWRSLDFPNSAQTVSNSMPGYYGHIGKAILMLHFQQLLLWKYLPVLANKRLTSIQPMSAADFITHVLVPEAAVLLIMQDQTQNSNGTAWQGSWDAANRVRANSVEYGRWRFREDGEFGRKTLAELSDMLPEVKRLVERTRHMTDSGLSRSTVRNEANAKAGSKNRPIELDDEALLEFSDNEGPEIQDMRGKALSRIFPSPSPSFPPSRDNALISHSTQSTRRRLSEQYYDTNSDEDFGDSGWMNELDLVADIQTSNNEEPPASQEYGSQFNVAMLIAAEAVETNYASNGKRRVRAC